MRRGGGQGAERLTMLLDIFLFNFFGNCVDFFLCVLLVSGYTVLLVLVW